MGSVIEIETGAGLETEVKLENYYFPLSLAQQRLWILSQFEGTGEAYSMPGAYEIQGRIDACVLQKCLSYLVERHESLRTTFKYVKEEPKQSVSSVGKLPLEIVDLRHESVGKRQAIIEEDYDAICCHKFDLEKGPLVKIKLLILSENRTLLLFSMHHIISDAWSIRVFLQELSLIYNALKQGKEIPLEPLSIQYADFAIWQHDRLASSEYEEQLNFWHEYLDGCTSYLPLPLDYARPALQKFSGKTYKFHLPDDVVVEIRNISKEHKVTMFMSTLAVFSLLLSRYSGEKDFVIGSPSSGRNRTELGSVIGFFINTLIIRLNIDSTTSFSEFLMQVRSTVLKAQAQQDFPLEKLLEELKIEASPSHNPLFQVMFSYQTENFDSFQIDSINMSRIPLEVKTSKFDLTLTLIEKNSGLEGEFEFSSELFKDSTIRQMAENYQELLANITNTPNKPVRQFPLLSSKQLEEIIYERNITKHFYETGICIDDLVSHQSERTPNLCAVKDDKESISYQELEQRSNQLARYLMQKDISAESIVGIFMVPSIEMVVSILGIFKAGCAYLPLDPSLPSMRLQYIVENAGVDIVLGRALSTLEFEIREKIDFELCLNEIENQSAEIITITRSEHDLAYMIYTSGSTGKPKGVEVEHHSVVNFLFSMQESLNFNANNTLLCVTSLSFDISVLEIFLPLITGATLVMASKTDVNNGEKLSQLINQSNISLMQATPSTWRILREVQWQPSRPFVALCGGEALPEDLAAWLADRVETLWNMYGPTETTIWSTMHNIKANAGPILIGKPIANTSIYVLDENQQPVPDGVTGELYIGGKGVTRGYRQNTEQTRKRFLRNPFVSQNERMYRTGDLVRYRDGGHLQYLGRTDDQIKFNGYRIELGEIETGLCDFNGISEAIVVNYASENNSWLVAYCTVDDNKVPSLVDVKCFLGQKLPNYMVPQRIIFIDEMPRTANGKVDRKALHNRELDQNTSTEQYDAPANRTEEILASIWTETLKVDKVGRNDNFFHLGGASLQSVIIVNKAAECGLVLKPEDIFEQETLSAVAKICEVVEGSKETLGDIDFHAVDKSHLSVDFKQLYEQESSQEKGADQDNIALESIGVYLPEKSVSSKDIVDQCTNPIRFPLQRVTGIKSRRIAAENEFSIDLAKQAIVDALSHSSYNAEQIELLICCNISRYDNDKQFYFEPSTSAKLAKHFHFKNAYIMDISNACTGFFSGIHIAQSFLLNNSVKNALVVSGEYITHLTHTVQKEVVDYLDSRIACLTLGDAGTAVILEKSNNPKIGFQDFEMFTLGAYSDLCTATKTEEPHGGIIMLTDAISMVEHGYQPSAMHTMDTINKNKWPISAIDYLIMHQTAEITIKNAKKEVNQMFNETVIHDDNLINNVTHRGNTATTTHFVALMDNIKSGKIKSGENIVFIINGSGMNFGTALYSLDNLPDRINNKVPVIKNTKTIQHKKPPQRTKPSGIVVGGIGLSDESLLTQPELPNKYRTSVDLLYEASSQCIEEDGCDKNQIDILIFSGVYRTDYIVEPAIAALLAGKLSINADSYDKKSRKTFVYDIINSSLGFLNACFTSMQYIGAGLADIIMVTAAEIENNREYKEYDNLGIAEVGSAVIIKNSAKKDKGFGGVEFYYYPEYIDLFKSYWTWDGGQHYIHFEKSKQLYDTYIQLISISLNQFLQQECITLADIDWVLPPVISSKFHDELIRVLDIEQEKIVEIKTNELDLHTSSIPYVLKKVVQDNKVKDGDVGLIISVGAGIQLGLALYYF